MNFERQPPRYVRVPPWELQPTTPNPLRGNPWFEECPAGLNEDIEV